jgi:NTE family protein
MGRGKIAVALGGGAARGWAHIGVLRALQQAGIHPDIVVGTSMGAVVGGCYVAGRLDELEEFACSLTRRKVFGFLDFNLSGSGLIAGRRLCDELDQHLEGLLIEKLDRRFVAVATELGTGHEVWLTRGHLVEAMRASYALPGIFKPVRVSGRWLMDGAIVNPIPVSVARAFGARTVIAVNLNGDHFGRGATLVPDEVTATPSEPGSGGLDVMPPAVQDTDPPQSAWKLLHRQFFGRNRDEPGISTVMVEAFNIIQDRIARARLMGDPPDFMITPRLSGVGLFEFHRARELVTAGSTTTQRQIQDLGELASSSPGRTLVPVETAQA